MGLISDRNVLRRFLKDGIANLPEKQLRSIIRLKLLYYDHGKKKYCLTSRAQGILEEDPVHHNPSIPHETPC